MDNHQKLTVDLRRRLNGLACVHPSVKDIVLQHAAEWSVEELNAYLTGPLAFVERYIGSIDDELFHKVCTAVTELPPEMNPGDASLWLHSAQEYQFHEPHIVLWVLANYYALVPHADRNNQAHALWLLAYALGYVNRDDDGVTLLEAFIAIGPGDYRQPECLAHKLDHFKKQVEINIACGFVLTLAGCLGFVNRHADGVRLLEDFAAIGLSDYGKPESLAKTLGHLKKHVHIDSACALVQVLANWLRLVNRADYGIKLVEAFTPFQAGDYFYPGALRQKLDTFKKQVNINNAGALMGALANLLNSVNRGRDSVTLLEAFANIRPEDYAHAETLIQRVAKLKRHMNINTACNLVMTLADLLGFVNRNDDGVMLLEAFDAIHAGDYDDSNALTQKLDTFKKQVNINNAGAFVRVLAERLGVIDRHVDGVNLVEAFVGIGPGDYDDPNALPQKLDTLKKQVNIASCCNLVTTLADLLGIENRHDNGVRLLETFAAFGLNDYAQRESLAQKLARLKQHVPVNNACCLVQVLADLLGFVNRAGDGVTLLEMNGLLDQKLTVESGNRCNMVTSWLRCAAGEEPQRVEEVCRWAVEFIRTSAASISEVENRRDFMRNIGPLRRQLVKTARMLAARGRGPDAHLLQRETLLWDLEISQAVLWNELLMGQIQATGDDGAEDPVNRWPFARRVAPFWKGHRPDRTGPVP